MPGAPLAARVAVAEQVQVQVAVLAKEPEWRSLTGPRRHP
jgi:hypothetical protein